MCKTIKDLGTQYIDTYLLRTDIYITNPMCSDSLKHP